MASAEAATARLRARIHTEQLGFIGQFVSQPALLEMLTTEAGCTANFQLEMGATVRGLLHDGERLAIRLLPLLARTGLLQLLLGKRLRAFQHGIVPVRLAV